MTDRKKDTVGDVALEGGAFNIEDKIDELIGTALTVRKELRRRTKWLVTFVVVTAVFLGSVSLGVWRLNSIATENRHNGQVTKQNSADIKHALQILTDATGPEAQDKQNKALSDTINDIKRSINCVGFYTLGKRPPACTATDGRMDEMDAGGDPFSH